MKLLPNFQKFYAVEGSGSLDIAAELATDDTTETAPEVSDDNDIKIEDLVIEDEGEETTDEDEEVDEDKVADESEVEDEDEIADILSPFSKKKFELKFPGALKEFPQIERALNTATKYREVFPTVNDALEAQSNLERYSEIEKDLETGSSKGLLGALKEKDYKSFGAVVDNYLLNLREIDEQAYFHVLGNNALDMVNAMSKHAERTKNQDLLTAAKILNEFVFQTEEIPNKTSFSKAEDPKESQLAQKEREFENKQLETHQDELTSRVDTQISKKISDFIDTKNQMTPYIKRNAIREANELVAEYIENDKEFSKIKDLLWARAKKAGYSQESIGNIRRAYISKANVYLPQAIKKVRANALSGGNTRINADADRKGPLARGKVASPQVGNKGTKSSKEIPKDMDSRSFLLQD